MQGIGGLLVDGFNRDGKDVLVASGLEEGFGVGAVGLVALAVASHMSGWKQRDLVAEGLELTPPVMGRSTSFHEDVGGRMMEEEGTETPTREPMLFLDATGSVGDGNLEDGLCEIHGDLGSSHEDPSPLFGPRGR